MNLDKMMLCSEAIINDAQIKALNNRLNELIQYNSPKYIQYTGGFKVVNDPQFDVKFKNITKEIEHRQNQIKGFYELNNTDFK